MAEAISNIGSASHLGESQVPRDSHFVYDYSRRRVPLPVISYMAVADTASEEPSADNPAKKSLDMLRDLIEPAVIAEEELEREAMEGLLRDALSKISEALTARPDEQPPRPGSQVSITVVLADARRAYIGHVGNTRIYLLHNERLYDLVPSGATSSPEPPAPPPEAAPTLFPLADGSPEGIAAPHQAPPGSQPGEESPPLSPAPAGQAPQSRPGAFPGWSGDAPVGFNQVDIQPGDIILLCTDGLWKTVSEEEIVENVLSAMNVQRSVNQLVRLAFSRDPSDNATMVAWQYGESEVPAASVASGRTTSARRAGTRVAEAMLVALLALVLVGIFAVGFAFGWRITDTFRKPAKEAARKAASAEAAKEEKKVEEQEAAEQDSAPPAVSDPAAQFPRPATVSGQGVRMRASPDSNSELIGLLRDGQQVTVLGEAMGADSKTWSRVKGTVRSGGQDTESEGYVRNDFLKVSTQSSPPASSAP